MNSFSAQLLITAAQKFVEQFIASKKQCVHVHISSTSIFLYLSLEFSHILNIHVASLSVQLLKLLHRLW